MSPTVGLIWARARRIGGWYGKADGPCGNWQMCKLANWQTGTRRRSRVWCYLLVCQFASLPVFARADEPVVLKAALTDGRVLRYDVDAKLEVQSGAQSEPEVLEQKLRLRFTVAKMSKDGSVVRAKLESAKVRTKTPGQDAAEFEWKEGDGPGAEEEP